MTTEVAAVYMGTHISGMEQSNVAGVLSTKTSSCVKPSSDVPHPKRCHTPDVGTMHPLGLPVEPEVYMRYMTSGGLHGRAPASPPDAVALAVASSSARRAASRVANVFWPLLVGWTTTSTILARSSTRMRWCTGYEERGLREQSGRGLWEWGCGGG